MGVMANRTQAAETKKDRLLTYRAVIVLGIALRHLELTAAGQEPPKDPLAVMDVHALAAFPLYLLTGTRKSELIGGRKKDRGAGKYLVDSPALGRGGSGEGSRGSEGGQGQASHSQCLGDFAGGNAGKAWVYRGFILGDGPSSRWNRL